MSWWAFGFGLSTVLVALFVPVVQLGPDVLGYPPLKLVVFVLGATTIVLVVFAFVNREDRRLYAVALSAAVIGMFLEYFVVAVAVAIVILMVLFALG
jgi:predicted branched-subunit amino acid permease